MEFDLDTCKRRTARLDLDGINFDAFRTDPLGPDELRCLRYMHDVEYHTVCYLRDLLLTSAHRDPEVTAFLSFWSYEEYWHGEAVGEVLAAHDEDAHESRVARMRGRLPWSERIKPFTHLVVSGLAGDDYTAVHMAWGAVNEWCTQAGYARLAARAGHPELRELLARIMRQEGRHIDFYATQATRRLEASGRARRLVRLALARFWRPVGAGVMPATETRFITDYLFGDDDGREVARRLDARIARLPGLDGLTLVTDAVRAA